MGGRWCPLVVELFDRLCLTERDNSIHPSTFPSTPPMTPRPACLAKQRMAAIRERNRRVIEHRQMVQPLANHYAHHSQESVEDLTQAGLLGLIREIGRAHV